MNKNELFLRTLDDLKQKIESNDSYQILKSSELIRTLLFDTSGPLVDKINREFRLKIEFEHKDTRSSYEKFPDNLKPDTYIVADGFYPEHMITAGTVVKSNRANFFNTMVIVLNKKEYTVKEILDYVVNCLGGTHHGNPKTEEQRVLSELDSLFFGNTNVLIHQIKSIGYVVFKALEELKDKVMKKYYS